LGLAAITTLAVGAASVGAYFYIRKK